MDNINIDYYKVLIAGYIHDIGKLLYRGGNERIKKEGINNNHAGLLFDLLTNSENYIKKNLGEENKYQNLINRMKLIEKSDFWKDIKIIAAHHHYKDFQKIKKELLENNNKLINAIFSVYMGDNIGSLERIFDNKEIKNVKKTGLNSIFGNILNIFIDEKEIKENEFKFNTDFTYDSITINDLNSEDFSNLDKCKFLPTKNETNFETIAKNFLIDFINFISNFEIERIKDDKNENLLKYFVYQLDMLLLNYFSFIPSTSYKDKIRDISLYDHSKNTALVSGIIFRNLIRNNELEKEKENIATINNLEDLDLSVIVGDFSGIQKYIANGFAKKTSFAKRLRAKSLRVQLITESIIEYILDQLLLDRVNLIQNAGGKFIILGDKIDKEKINKITKNINEELYTQFNGHIQFNLGLLDKKKGSDIFGVSIKNIKEDNNEFEEQNKNRTEYFDGYSDLYLEIEKELSKKKSRPYGEENLELLETIFTEENVSGKEICNYCNQGYINKGSNKDYCSNCDNEIELGREIPKLLQEAKKEKDISKTNISIQYKDNNGNFKYKELIKNKKEIKNKDLYLKMKINNIIVSQLENGCFEKEKMIYKGLNLYIPYNTIKDKKEETVVEVLNFEEIIKKDKNKIKKEQIEEERKRIESRDYICLVKGDIDAMSLILKHGFKNLIQGNSNKQLSIYSISRIMTFSRFLELFFGHILNNFLIKKYPNVYTVFSGGDDFVFIVPFSERIDFVNDLRRLFYNFVAKNNKIHFSIGVGIFHYKDPFHKMDEKTEDLLKKAKSIGKEKNKDIFQGNIENNIKELLNKEDIKDKLNKYSGVCYYEEIFGKEIDNQFNKNSNENQINKEQTEIKNLDDITNIENGKYYLDKIFNYKIDNKEVFSETKIYKTYEILKEILILLDNEEQSNIDWANISIKHSRLIYLITKNINKDDIKDVKNFLSNIVQFGKIKQMKKNIINILTYLTDKIYENRY